MKCQFVHLVAELSWYREKSTLYLARSAGGVCFEGAEGEVVSGFGETLHGCRGSDCRIGWDAKDDEVVDSRSQGEEFSVSEERKKRQEAQWT